MAPTRISKLTYLILGIGLLGAAAAIVIILYSGPIAHRLGNELGWLANLIGITLAFVSGTSAAAGVIWRRASHLAGENADLKEDLDRRQEKLNAMRNEIDALRRELGEVTERLANKVVEKNTTERCNGNDQRADAYIRSWIEREGPDVAELIYQLALTFLANASGEFRCAAFSVASTYASATQIFQPPTYKPHRQALELVEEINALATAEGFHLMPFAKAKECLRDSRPDIFNAEQVLWAIDAIADIEKMITHQLYNVASPLVQRVVAVLQKNVGADAVPLLRARYYQSMILRSLGHYEDAIKALEGIIAAQNANPALGPNHPNTITTRTHYAGCLRDSGRLAEALKEIDQTILVEETVPPHMRNPRGRSASRLERAIILCALAQNEEALNEIDRAISESVLPQGHPDMLAFRNTRATVLGGLDRHGEALREIEQVIALQTSNPLVGPTHPGNIASRHDRATHLCALRRNDEALSEIDEVIALRKSNPNFGEYHPLTIVARQVRAAILVSSGKYEAALQEIENTLAVIHSDSTTKPIAQDIIGLKKVRVDALRGLHRYNEAIKEIDEIIAAESADPSFGPSHRLTLASQAMRRKIVRDSGLDTIT